MPRKTPFPYTHRVTDRYGCFRFYFRRPGYPPVPLPGLYGSVEFIASYQAAMAAKPPPIGAARTIAGGMNAVIVSYYQSAEFKGLRASTARVYRNILERFREAHGDKSAVGMQTKHVRKLMAEKAATPDAANRLLGVANPSGCKRSASWIANRRAPSPTRQILPLHFGRIDSAKGRTKVACRTKRHERCLERVSDESAIDARQAHPVTSVSLPYKIRIDGIRTGAFDNLDDAIASARIARKQGRPNAHVAVAKIENENMMFEIENFDQKHTDLEFKTIDLNEQFSRCPKIAGKASRQRTIVYQRRDRPPSGPEVTKRLSGTHKGTKPEHQAALRKASEGARSGLIPSMFSDASCLAAQM